MNPGAFARPLVAAAALTLLLAVPAAQLDARPAVGKIYANFAVTVTGTQATVVTGTVSCPDPSGDGPDIAVPFKGTDDGTFTTRSRVLQLSRIDRVIGVTLPHVEGYGPPTLPAHGTITRASNWPTACGTNPDPGCGAATLPHFQIEVQSGAIGGVSITIRKPPAIAQCRMPATAPFPELVVPGFAQDDIHLTYSAPVPPAMLDPSKRVIVIHAVGRLTEHQSEPAQTWKATTSLNYTMRLVRARS